MPRYEHLKLDAEFKALCGPTTLTADRCLELQLLRTKGPIEPLVVWRGPGLLVDGYRRAEICKKYSFKFPVRLMDFKNRYDAIIYRCESQLCRRANTNLETAHCISALIDAYARHFGAPHNPLGLMKCYEIARERLGGDRELIRKYRRIWEKAHKLDRQVRVPLLLGEAEGSLEDMAELLKKNKRSIERVLRSLRRLPLSTSEILKKKPTPYPKRYQSEEAKELLRAEKYVEQMSECLQKLGRMVPVDAECSQAKRMAQGLAEIANSLVEMRTWAKEHGLMKNVVATKLKSLTEIRDEARHSSRRRDPDPPVGDVVPDDGAGRDAGAEGGHPEARAGESDRAVAGPTD